MPTTSLAVKCTTDRKCHIGHLLNYSVNCIYRLHNGYKTTEPLTILSHEDVASCKGTGKEETLHNGQRSSCFLRSILSQYEGYWYDVIVQGSTHCIEDKLERYFCSCRDVFVYCSDARFSGYLLDLLLRSRKFRRRMSAYSFKNLDITTNCYNNVTITLLTNLNQILWIDFGWASRITWLLLRIIQLEDAMNWLNTLGGGYSALGDYFQHHACKAGSISITQLRLAMEMGDIPVVIRCRLYYGLSLMQRGLLREAKRIIRSQYREAMEKAKCDLRLHNMCRGLWMRLRYLYEQRQTNCIGL